MDQLTITLLRSHAASLWERYPYMSQDAVEQSVREHGNRIDATYSELLEAVKNLPSVRS